MNQNSEAGVFSAALFLLLFLAIFLVGLFSRVPQEVPEDYARRAFPECADFRTLNHRWSKTSQTEISMVCPEGSRRSVTIKCVHGWGVWADTTCHENN